MTKIEKIDRQEIEKNFDPPIPHYAGIIGHRQEKDLTKLMRISCTAHTELFKKGLSNGSCFVHFPVNLIVFVFFGFLKFLVS